MKEIKLTQGKVAFVDDEDYERINRFKWYAHNCGNTFYATRHKKNSTKLIRMHQEVMQRLSIQAEIDHKNGNGLDNRKYNLRLCTHHQNQSNRHKSSKGTSIYRGVHKKTNQRKWRVRIGKEGCHLGYYDDEIQAAKVYDTAAFARYGEFAQLNFPKEEAGQLALWNGTI